MQEQLQRRVPEQDLHPVCEVSVISPPPLLPPIANSSPPSLQWVASLVDPQEAPAVPHHGGHLSPTSLISEPVLLASKAVQENHQPARGVYIYTHNTHTQFM